ncbi:MAG: FkbM family methyltransferase [Lentisphaerae bacterium]|nr:FkbM family methyltransferase [Lentisphaerota bacterium]
MTVLDIGANVGYQAFTMASIVGDGGHVFAVEPDPRNLRLLRANVRLNGWDDRVSVHACAVSDHDGTVPFRVARRSNLNSLAITRHTRDSKTIEIPIVSLDSFFEKRPPPNFIKMDIEGHEVEVLRGFEETLRNKQFLIRILMEVHPVMYTGEHSLREVLEMYLSLGFHCKYLVSAAEPRPPAIARRGYEPAEVVAMKDKHQRAIYADLSDEDAVDFACRLHDGVKVVRALLIERPALET